MKIIKIIFKVINEEELKGIILKKKNTAAFYQVLS